MGVCRNNSLDRWQFGDHVHLFNLGRFLRSLFPCMSTPVPRYITTTPSTDTFRQRKHIDDEDNQSSGSRSIPRTSGTDPSSRSLVLTIGPLSLLCELGRECRPKKLTESVVTGSLWLSMIKWRWKVQSVLGPGVFPLPNLFVVRSHWFDCVMFGSVYDTSFRGDFVFCITKKKV